MRPNDSWKDARCPRCGGQLLTKPDDTGALSRVDDATIVCSACGAAEAELGPRGKPGVHSRQGWFEEGEK